MSYIETSDILIRDMNKKYLQINYDLDGGTVADGGSFHADVIVESGKGYVAHDVPRDVKGDSIDVLPIDATFMPIKRVSYTVENTRVGDSIDFDKLTLEIWSNGSVDVTNALSQASNLLIDHFMQISAITGQPVIAPSMTIEEEKEDELTFLMGGDNKNYFDYNAKVKDITIVVRRNIK